MEKFSDRLKDFIKFSQGNVSNHEIKSEYLKLVKEYHPDTNKNVDFDLANEYMININYAYEHLINKKAFTNKNKIDGEYEKNIENGKYWFINDYGRKEYVKEKSLYIFKLGLLEYQKCYRIMFNNSVFNGKRDESGYEVIKHLYECYLLAKKTIEMDKNGIYGSMAKILIDNAYKMNESITHGLKTSDEKAIIP
jgi:curved DNA-binding protein CbpA